MLCLLWLAIFFLFQRLAKRWISTHLFSSFISEEAVELVVAYLFLKPFPFHAPASQVAGFLRYTSGTFIYNLYHSLFILAVNSFCHVKTDMHVQLTKLLYSYME
jgi:U3 small nucleolar RNA-associated protein 22